MYSIIKIIYGYPFNDKLLNDTKLMDWFEDNDKMEGLLSYYHGGSGDPHAIGVEIDEFDESTDHYLDPRKFKKVEQSHIDKFKNIWINIPVRVKKKIIKEFDGGPFLFYFFTTS